MWKTTSAEDLVGDWIRAWTQSQRFKPGTSTHSFPSADGGERQWSSVQGKQAHRLRLRSGPWPSVNTTLPHADSHWRSTSSSGPPGGRKHHADFLPSFLVDAALVQAAADEVQHLMTQTVLFLKELTVRCCHAALENIEVVYFWPNPMWCDNALDFSQLEPFYLNGISKMFPPPCLCFHSCQWGGRRSLFLLFQTNAA